MIKCPKSWGGGKSEAGKERVYVCKVLYLRLNAPSIEIEIALSPKVPYAKDIRNIPPNLILIKSRVTAALSMR